MPGDDAHLPVDDGRCKETLVGHTRGQLVHDLDRLDRVERGGARRSVPWIDERFVSELHVVRGEWHAVVPANPGTQVEGDDRIVLTDPEQLRQLVLDMAEEPRIFQLEAIGERIISKIRRAQYWFELLEQLRLDFGQPNLHPFRDSDAELHVGGHPSCPCRRRPARSRSASVSRPAPVRALECSSGDRPGRPAFHAASIDAATCAAVAGLPSGSVRSGTAAT